MTEDFLLMGTGNSFNPKTQVCKYAWKITISNMRGQYWGEMFIDSETAHGRGVFRSEDGIVSCRYFRNGEFAEGSSLEFNLITG
jgi:hypothetical protein